MRAWTTWLIMCVWQVLRRLRAAGPPAAAYPRLERCAAPHDALFLQGRCLVSISTAATFSASALTPGSGSGSSAMRGRMGIALAPGSTQVLDRSTRALAPCTPKLCPLAMGKTQDKGNVTRPVNRPIPARASLAVLSTRSPLQYQLYALQLLAWASPTASRTPDTGSVASLPSAALPLRRSEVAASTLPAWEAGGYHAEDAAAFLAAYGERVHCSLAYLVQPGAK